MTEKPEAYISRHTSPASPILNEIYRYTWLNTIYPRMASGHVQGKFLAMLAGISKARNILEIGSFTGYSAIAMAEALPQNGKLTTIEANEELEPILHKFILQSGQENKINLMIGQAHEILSQLINESFDFIFLDADKISYPMYFPILKNLLAKDGLLIADNVLWGNKVLDDNDKDPETVAIRRFNSLVAEDECFEQLILPLRDGLMIARKIC